jgi:outer membrane protein TolC
MMAEFRPSPASHLALSHKYVARALPWLCIFLAGCVPSGLWNMVVPEQRCLDIRDPSQLPQMAIPPIPEPETVSKPIKPVDPSNLSLDEAIRISLANSTVVRVLAGVTAVSSGQTVYEPAISNTFIDEARAMFDPNITVRNAFSRFENPPVVFDPADPALARITGASIDNYELGLGITKKLVTGGTASFEFSDVRNRFRDTFSVLNPQAQSAATLSFTQPLLQGAGVEANIAPIVIARINTERSYFQLKDSMQDLVRGTIEAYWAVVFARTDAWARRQQVEQGAAAMARAEARKRQGFGNAAEVAQAQVALSNFKANLIAADANLLQREAALRNILGLSPVEPLKFVPTSAPTPVRIEPHWDEILRLASEYRPDLIELKLIIEADRQSLIIAQNQALPRVDATMLYRWNGLEGQTPSGALLRSEPGQFTDWSLGVNFAVPLGLRQSRAGLRRSELVLARDRANLDQGLHFASHALAANIRNLSQFFEQYKAYQETRKAARINLEQQLAEFRSGRAIFLNVLQAITDWGNAVSSEAQALAQYNIELANLERQTGTILETHGVHFVEERFRSIGPLGRCAEWPCYPKSVVPGPNEPKYPTTAEPAEKLFEHEKPALPQSSPPKSPTPFILPPTPEKQADWRSLIP